jgi:GNAT superfamily N-acetyltransferase
MRCDKVDKSAFCEPPNNLSLLYYCDGDEKHWVKIQKSVGEFDSYSNEAVYKYFSKNYLINTDEALKRIIFLVDKKTGVYIGTCSAWFEPKCDGFVPVLHWLAVRDGYENNGYARLLITETMKRFSQIYGDNVPVYLHTQPCSYKAIKLYSDFGFSVTKEDTYSNAINECDEGLIELKKYMKPNVYRKIEQSVVL